MTGSHDLLRFRLVMPWQLKRPSSDVRVVYDSPKPNDRYSLNSLKYIFLYLSIYTYIVSFWHERKIILWSLRLFGWNSMNGTGGWLRSKTNDTSEQISVKDPHRKVKGGRQHQSSTRILGYGFIVVAVVVIIIGRLHEIVSKKVASKETTRGNIKSYTTTRKRQDETATPIHRGGIQVHHPNIMDCTLWKFYAFSITKEVIE